MAAQATQRNTFAVAALAGLAGAAVGLLFAPRSGRETREHLKNSARDMKQKAEHGKDVAKDSAKHFASAIKHTGQEAKQQFDEMQDNS